VYTYVTYQGQQATRPATFPSEYYEDRHTKWEIHI